MSNKGIEGGIHIFQWYFQNLNDIFMNNIEGDAFIRPDARRTEIMDS